MISVSTSSPVSVKKKKGYRNLGIIDTKKEMKLNFAFSSAKKKTKRVS